MAFISYHNFMEVESRTKKMSDKEKKIFYEVVVGYERNMPHVKLICALAKDVPKDIKDYLDAFKQFKEKITTTINSGENSRKEMLRTADMIRPGLPRDQIEKMDKMIEQTAEIDKYNLDILREIIARCVAIG